MNPFNNTQRFVGSFRCAGTDSFRLASGKFFEFGSNAQNPPKPLLDTLVARKGYTFVQPDQSGAEALIMAYLAKPGRYRKLFSCGIKPHVFLALHIFAPSHPEWFEGLPTTADKFLAAKDPAELAKLPGWKELKIRIQNSGIPYYCGKKTAHAKSYRMGPKTFQIFVLKDSHGTLLLRFADGKSFLVMFEGLFPEIIELQDEIVEEAKTTGMLYNLLGFPRRCEKIFSHNYERQLISWKAQSTVGCITHNAAIAMSRFKQWRLLNNKHDSMLHEVPDSDVMDCAIEGRKAMAQKLVGRDGVEFTMGSEVQAGKNWAPYDPIKNPQGMKTIL